MAWDGVTARGNTTHVIGDDSYVVRVSVLKPLGSAASPADIETWASRAFTIGRP